MHEKILYQNDILIISIIIFYKLYLYTRFDKFYNFNKKKLLPLNKGTAGKVALKSLQIVSKTLKLKIQYKKFPKLQFYVKSFLSKRNISNLNWIRGN